MTMAVISTKPVDMAKDIFKEGNLVVTDEGKVDLVTVIAQGYDEDQPGTFWAINLETGVSGGNYCKSCFKQFVGTVTLEGKF